MTINIYVYIDAYGYKSEELLDIISHHF
jgi:hypothetical protein